MIAKPTTKQVPEGTSPTSSESDPFYQETKMKCKKKFIWVFAPNFRSFLTGDWIRKIKPIKVCPKKVVSWMESLKSTSSLQIDGKSSLLSSTTSKFLTSTPSTTTMTSSNKIEEISINSQKNSKRVTIPGFLIGDWIDNMKISPKERSTLLTTATYYTPGSSTSTTMASNDITETIQEKSQEDCKMFTIPAFKNFGKIEIPICNMNGNPTATRISRPIPATTQIPLFRFHANHGK